MKTVYKFLFSVLLLGITHIVSCCVGLFFGAYSVSVLDDDMKRHLEHTINEL